ncbi:HigA family addiction module antitoxin [Bradyrhizobium sp. CB1717]|uniref:HigA family addiction module antitoxin n=1 Tax=Bradyrhizobium sp. CB1717 TaxID=3039154 RepID=UPI0024B04501|nr:HigA family addiction module antitoxin [Bradyrhizobium sp. CB1717]WFU21923.1 HigA family addiction module antitoxin [Bradyrhizobium sp. CB1717]
MTEYKAIRDRNRAPSHPGAAIDDILADVRVSKTQVADRLGISRQHLHDILAGNKPLSASVAVRVAALFGGSAESWLRMQAAYDAWHAAREVDVSHIRRLEVA